MPDSPAPADRHSVPMSSANLVGTLLGALAAAPPFALHAAVWGLGPACDAVRQLAGQPLIWVPALLIGVLAHELIHARVWARYAPGGRASTRLGFQWRTLTPFAHVSEPIPARGYRLGALAPGLVVGLIPSLVGTATGYGPLAALGWFFTFVAGGDLLVVWLLRGVPGGTLVQDHPTRAGCVVREHG